MELNALAPLYFFPLEAHTYTDYMNIWRSSSPAIVIVFWFLLCALPTTQAVAGQKLASKAVALGDAKKLRKYLEASLNGNSSVLAGVVDGKTSW